MILMWALAILSGIGILITTGEWGQGTHTEYTAGEADAVAAQMQLYHQAAVDTCLATVCPNGTVNPTAKLPNAFVSNPRYTNGDFVSAANGTGIVITVFMHKEDKNSDRSLSGEVATALVDRRQTSVNVGTYNASNGTISAGYINNNGAPLYVVPTIPEGFGGVTIPDKAPIMVTRVQ